MTYSIKGHSMTIRCSLLLLAAALSTTATAETTVSEKDYNLPKCSKLMSPLVAPLLLKPNNVPQVR
jgi:hypothetical protein